MSKDPTPRADALRAQREARFGHLQATADGAAKVAKAAKVAAPKKLIPYAGKAPGGREDLMGNKNPTSTAKPARKRRKLKRKIA